MSRGNKTVETAKQLTMTPSSRHTAVNLWVKGDHFMNYIGFKLLGIPLVQQKEKKKNQLTFIPDTSKGIEMLIILT